MASVYDMNYVDFVNYAENKKAWESGAGDRGQLAAANSALRDKYGIAGDSYSYSGLMQSAPSMPNQYSTAADKAYANLGNYPRYTDPFNTRDTLRELENFRYNHETDPNYQAYKDATLRQGQAAQGQTLSNLTALSGGRANSWASAAAAQVGQAYSQKVGEMIPQFAQQAYDKILQRYGLAAQENERAYGRHMDKYNIDRDVAGLYQQRAQYERDLLRQRAQDELDYRDRDLAYDSAAFQFGLDKQYSPAERAANISLLQQAVARGEIELEYLPEQIKQGLEAGYYSIEQVKQAIEEGRIKLEYYPQILQAQLNPNKGGGGGGGPDGRKPSDIAGMSKTAIKEAVNRQFGDEKGKLNKSKLLKALHYGGYSDEDITAIINAVGISNAEIKEWQKNYAETVRGYMFVEEPFHKNPLNLPR